MTSNPGTMKKLTAAEFATVIKHAAAPPEAAEALKGCTDIADAIDRLEAAGFNYEAVRVLAYALPKRESVWWACMCALATAPPDLGEEHRKARETTELWVRQQKDEQRRAAYDFGTAVEFKSPEAWAALAAFWSGGSISLPDLPAVAATPEACGKAAGVAITLSALRGRGDRQVERLKRFLESGRNIAAGGPGRIPPEEP